MAESILTSVKKNLGIIESDTSFDTDILTHINSTFSTLHQLGIGPEEGFSIESSTATWDTFLGTDSRLNSVKTYMYLSVRLYFDPPTSSYAVDAMQKQLRELEWRINVVKEGDLWSAQTQG